MGIEEGDQVVGEHLEPGEGEANEGTGIRVKSLFLDTLCVFRQLIIFLGLQGAVTPTFHLQQGNLRGDFGEHDEDVGYISN